MPSESINRLCRWITNCANKNDYKLSAIYLRGEDVNYSNIEKCIRKDGVVFIKCMKDEPQFIIINNINELNTYIFDSKYEEDEDYTKDFDVRVIESKPFD